MLFAQQPATTQLQCHNKPMLPQVMKSLENQIQILTYPQVEKDGMLYMLRDALSKQVPDVIAKVIVEVGAKILSAK